MPMKNTFHTRWYTNVILTVIAVLLALGFIRNHPVQLASSAYAGTDTSSRYQTSPTGVKVDTSIPQTQDLAVAAATHEVAAATQDIASSIRELAKSVEFVGSSLDRARSNASSA